MVRKRGFGRHNSVGNLGGFFGPTMVGWAKDYTGSFAAGLYALAGFALLSAVVSALGQRRALGQYPAKRSFPARSRGALFGGLSQSLL
jgi:ACS family tartrate transporter-like MFS transporter